MPTLRAVPDPRDDRAAPYDQAEPDALDVAVAAPDPAMEAATSIRTRWFPCTEPAVGAAVRAHVLTALNAWAVGTDTIADAMVLVSELVTNVRDHTGSDVLGVRVGVTTDRIVVAVVEHTRTEAPRDSRFGAAPVGDTPPELPMRHRGRGLQILDAMASEWGFTRTDGVSTAWFALPAAPPVVPGREPEIRRF